MKLFLLIAAKIFILFATPYLWLWTHFSLPQTQRKKTREIVKRSQKIGKRKLPVLIHIVLFLLLLGSFQSGTCQEYIDIIKLNYNYTALNTFNNSDVKTTIAEIDLEATIPIVINDKATFVTGLYGEAFRVKLDVDDLSKNIYAFSPKLGLNFMHGKKWSGTYMLLPKVASDFVNVSSKDFQIGGFVLMKYNRKPNLNYKVGVYANSEFFGPWVVPLIGLYYVSQSKKFEANLTLPFAADINYRIANKVTSGISFAGQTKSYHVTSPIIDGKQGYLARATAELYGYVSFNTNRNIIIQTKVGHSFGRYYRVFDDGDRVGLGMPLVFFNDNRSQLNSDFADGWVFQLMAIYRLQLPK